jgi:sugar phosphate isomerase/epimerase
MHARVSVSAMSTWRWTLQDDLAFYASAGITNVGASLAKLDAHGIDDGIRLLRGAGLRITNLLGIGPFRLADRDQWPASRDRVRRAFDAAERLGAECLVLTTGPAAPLSWEEAADALADALGPVLAEGAPVPLALEHTNSLRPDVGFVHTLRDAIDLAARLDVGVCMECNACWGERGLGATIADGVDRLRLVQVSDFVVGTLCTPDRAVPGDGHIPLARIVGQVVAAGYGGVFDLELIGPRIEEEGYASAVTRSVERLEALLASLGVEGAAR